MRTFWGTVSDHPGMTCGSVRLFFKMEISF